MDPLIVEVQDAQGKTENWYVLHMITLAAKALTSFH